MGSMGSPVVGQFMHPVIDDTTQNDDPWQRNYFQPPPMKKLVPRNYPLIDIRQTLDRPDYSPTELLRTHGFGVVKHSSDFLADYLGAGDLAENAVAEIYHPETADLVARTLGAKKVFVLASVFRQGKRAPEAFALPTSLKSMAQAKSSDAPTSDKPAVAAAEPPKHRLAGQAKLSLAAPVRVPHMDFTPLGARQTIRSQTSEINETALQSGIIAYEDAICASAAGGAVQAPTVAADNPVADHYNNPGQGNSAPHYAAFSIWRPLKRVSRDPLSLAPRVETPSAAGELVHWRYLNKVPGQTELGGDYLKEYAMLGVQGEEPPTTDLSPEESLKWYYVSDQNPDEVLFIKLFDSASLGSGSAHAGAPWHASPEIGDAAHSDDPRESIDVRVLVFW